MAAAPAKSSDDVRKELRDYLNGVRDRLEKGGGASNPGDLLDYLGKLSDYLPEREKKRFRGSNERLAMESLKAQLAGKKGLRQKVAESFRPTVPRRKEPMTRSRVVDTFSYLKDLAAWHPDKAVGAAMREQDRIHRRPDGEIEIGYAGQRADTRHHPDLHRQDAQPAHHGVQDPADRQRPEDLARRT